MLKTIPSQEKAFKTGVILENLPDSLLKDAITFITDHFSPGDIFTDKELQEWTQENGYVKES
jgi:hypothetical protein